MIDWLYWPYVWILSLFLRDLYCICKSFDIANIHGRRWSLAIRLAACSFVFTSNKIKIHKYIDSNSTLLTCTCVCTRITQWPQNVSLFVLCKMWNHNFPSCYSVYTKNKGQTFTCLFLVCTFIIQLPESDYYIMTNKPLHWFRCVILYLNITTI